jgi:hypothetical protein
MNGSATCDIAMALCTRVLQRQRVDDGGQHPHVIARGALDAVFAAGQTAKNVPAADDHDHLHAKFAHLADLPGHVAHRLGANADAVFATKRLAAELEQNPGKFRFFGGRHKTGSARGITEIVNILATRGQIKAVWTI